MVKIYYTASGIPIPEEAVVELDSNNLVAVWNSRILREYEKRNSRTKSS